ncbi:MAG: hypothetical protein ACE5PO_01935 [Candidatus Bathyarchaeia archaeon]
MSFLSSHLKQTGDVLRRGAHGRILEYERKLNFAEALYDEVLKNLMVTSFNRREAYDAAVDFFGSNKFEFSAIDGTEYSRALFDLLIFFGGAFEIRGTVELLRDKPPTVCYDEVFITRSSGVSSCVPLYVNEVLELDQAFMSAEEPGELSLSTPLELQGVADNSTIANAIMTFSEYYLAYKRAANPESNVKMLLMDRSLSGTQGSLLYDTSKRPLWKRLSALLGFEIDSVAIDENDIAYGRQRLANKALSLPPTREDFLRYRLAHVVEEEPSTFEDLCRKLEITEADRKTRLQKLLKAAVREKYLRRSQGGYTVNPRYRDSWLRIRKLVHTIGDRLFSGAASVEEVMRVEKAGKRCWLTTLDMKLLTLFSLYMLVEECWKNNILLVGISKDTVARDFSSRLLPVMVNEGVWTMDRSRVKLEDFPSTDRLLLQAASVAKHEELPVPWALVEYDSAFQTIIPDRKKRKGFVAGAIQNRISLERLFLRSFVQLSQGRFDPKLRSNVLLIDRLVHPSFDYQHAKVTRFRCDYAGAEEPVDVILHRDKDVSNPLQQLMLIVMKTMSAESIPEVFGHNKPLFVADKVAKWFQEQVRGVIHSTGHWIANNHDLRDYVLYMNTFRERRTEIERTRR